MSTKATPRPKTIRCAIYTRKSTEEGLDQQYNSLDSQRDAGESYIRSQANEGWELVPDRYDDGGFSGGNIERPALKRMMEDIQAGKIDCVVVYKVDRLSRSLLDFARVMETFDKFNVSFVSVTQHFNTTHSMGRLTLNILLSFAQFEREIIGERIRDKLAAQCRRGQWTGGYRHVKARRNLTLYTGNSSSYTRDEYSRYIEDWLLLRRFVMKTGARAAKGVNKDDQAVASY